MSHDAVLQLYFNHPTTLEKIVTTLFDAGWSLNDYGKISLYVESGHDEYDWVDMKLVEEKDFFTTLKREAKNTKLVGIVLSWKFQEEGISLLMHDPKVLIVGMRINRRKLENSIFSDVTWYLDRVLTPLAQTLKIESFSWSDHV